MPAGAFACIDHSLALGDAHRHGLLHGHVQAARECSFRHFRVHRMRRQDLHHVEVVLQECGVVGVSRGLRKFDLAAGKARRIGVAQSDDCCVRMVTIAA